MSKKSTQKKWQVYSREVVYQNPWYRIIKEDLKKPSGFRGDYFILEGRGEKDFVVVVVLDENENFYLVKQWRPTLKRYLLEFAAGGTEKNESFLEAAKREVKEELGLQAQNWQHLGRAAVAPGHSKEYGQFFLATKIKPTKAKVEGEPGEKTEAVKLSHSELVKKIYAKEIEDGPTLTAYLLYLAWKKEL